MRREHEEMELALASPRAAPPSPPVDADGELVARVARGDGGAFEALYRRYVRPVYALALRRLGDRHSAEDAVQETFAAVWRSARTFRPERGPAAPWLFSIARNAAVDRLRARAPVVAEVPDFPDEAAGPSAHAEAEWLAWRVHRALEELPATEREVIALAYWGGRSQSEVAAQLGIPLGTVKTRTRSGLARLADLLEGELE
ncbi:MAG: sigma-70 family RNA polymerase sigma factor [Gaiellaceae bacterium]